ncbi:hypothetical protein GCM10008955_19910 [Deinococcus malanensis]|uniref:Uncharacterized protein n=2 Tax=Deinococcus malanensis TaxID=1706855 RepID=A0ABQ2EY06_9DEIO|nr:hypothetical protein GCM10008955_19910 [Deinococcus malanensis]
MVLFLAACAAVALVSVWQIFQVALPYPAGRVGAGVVSLLLPALLTRRPPVGVQGAGVALLRAPVPGWVVLCGALLPQLAVQAILGLAAGGLLAAWLPNWAPLALALPMVAVAHLLLRAVAHDARLAGRRGTLQGAVGSLALPLLSIWAPTMLPLLVTGTALVLALLWQQLWLRDLPPQAIRRLQVEAIRQGARRLNLPPVDVTPDGEPWPRRWTPILRGHGPFAAMWWRGTLHLGRRPALLWPALLLGGGALALTWAPAMPVPLAVLLSLLLPLLPPAVPLALPLPGHLRPLVRTAPAGVMLGLLALPGALVGIVLGLPVALGAATALMPWAALNTLAWLQRSGHTGTPQGELRFGAALLPVLAAVLCVHLGATAWAPLAVALAGGLPLLSRAG